MQHHRRSYGLLLAGLFLLALCGTFTLRPAFADTPATPPLFDDALTPPPPPPDLAAAFEARGPSQFMAGSVAVRLILPESDGSLAVSSEDWTPEHISAVTARTQAALDWWAAQLPLANLRFELETLVVPTGYEAVNHGLSDEGLWIGETLGALGYSGNYFDQAYAAVYDHRRERATDWSFLIFVANSSNDDDGRFSDGRIAYAYIGGPMIVMTSDAGSYGAAQLSPVIAHEMGHIFGALDQYSAARIPCNQKAGYLGTPTTNSQIGGCPTNLPSIMLEPVSAYANNAVDPSALHQLGYRDLDADGIIDPLDTTPELNVTLTQSQPGARPRLSGSALDVPYQSTFQRKATINRITRVEYRSNGGPWFAVAPLDGVYDATFEEFDYEVPLYDGDQQIEVRALNSVGNVSPSATFTVGVTGFGTQPHYAFTTPDAVNTSSALLTFVAPAGTTVQAALTPSFSAGSWQPAQAELALALPATDGVYTVYVRFRAADGLLSPILLHTVQRDTLPPSGTVTLQAGVLPHALIEADDCGSGITGIEVQTNYGGLLNQWQPFTPAIDLPAGTTFVRVRFRDAAGNVSPYVESTQTYQVFLPNLQR